jgi:hypothetical protein
VGEWESGRVGEWESGAVHASKWERVFRGRAKDVGEVCWAASKDRDGLVMAGWEVDEGTRQGFAARHGEVR